VTTSYPRFSGDSAGGFVHGLSRYLRRRGHRVTVICAGDGVANKYELLDGIEVHRLSSSLFFHGGAPDVLSEGLVRAPVATLLRAGRFSGALLTECVRRLASCDGLISHWLVPCGLLATLCQGKRPHVAIAHSSDIHLLRRFHAQSLVRWLSAKTRLIYSASHLQIDGAPGDVVPMGIDVADFSATETQRLLARRTIGGFSKKVLFLGRLVPVKGVSVLMAAVAQLAIEVPVELIVAGDGPALAALQSEADRLGLPVRFVGAVSGMEKQTLLWAADCLVLPSLQLADGRTEGAPVVLWEALAAGCPVVASSVGGVAEQLQSAGLLTKPGEVGSLLGVLRQVLCDETTADKLRTAGLLRAQAADWSVIGPRLLGPALMP
jgi:glycosyltransferase involved in cell wall biosynthesis